MKRSSHDGFTLLEVLVAATIIAVLAAIAVTSYTSINKRGRDAKRKSDLEQIRSALEMYRADNGYYPSTGSGGWVDASGALGLSALLVPTYMPVIPSDSNSLQFYQYQATSVSGGQYYGYCLSANLEAEDPQDTCTPYTGYTYGVKNP